MNLITWTHNGDTAFTSGGWMIRNVGGTYRVFTETDEYVGAFADRADAELTALGVAV